MNYDFVIIKTPLGKNYANKILHSIEWIQQNRQPQHTFRTHLFDIEDFYQQIHKLSLNPETTIIHPRAAHPDGVHWITRLRELEATGYKVVNSVDTITTTANKLKCAMLLQNDLPHPKTWEYRKNSSAEQISNLFFDISHRLNMPEFIIAKPLTSLEQGLNVKKINWHNMMSTDEIKLQFDQVPGSKIVVQEFFPYTAMHRVIVIDRKAVPYTFVDKTEWRKPGDWKVSCCLNKTSMRLDENPNEMILDIAQWAQQAVGGRINFIDIFENEKAATVEQRFSISEINTACSLIHHERLARQAGRTDWNIHAKIARSLVKHNQNR